MAVATRRLHVLTLVDRVGVHGGAEALAWQVAMNLDQSRFNSVFCASRMQPSRQREQRVTELDEAGVRFLALERRSSFDQRPWLRLISYIRQQQVDVLHTHKIGSNTWGALLSPFAPVPVFVAHEHSWSFEGQPLRRVLDRQLIARRADALIAVSEADRRRMHRVERIPMEKLRFVPNGIPALDPPDPGVDLRTDFAVAPGCPVIGAVATLRPVKALDVLIRAAVPLKARFPGLKVLIAGASVEGDVRDPEREKLAALARELGVGDEIVFLGRRSDVSNVLAALDVAILSSDFEGSPLSVLEYMAAGKPVVATRVGGVPDVVEDGVTGFLVDPQDPNGLASAVAQLLDDPSRAAAMGRAGRERCRRKFSIENTTRQIEGLYEELYSAKSLS